MSSTKEQARRRDYYYNDPQKENTLLAMILTHGLAMVLILMSILTPSSM